MLMSRSCLRLAANVSGLKEVATIRNKVTMENGINISALTCLKGDALAISFKPLLCEWVGLCVGSFQKSFFLFEGWQFNHFFIVNNFFQKVLVYTKLYRIFVV